MERYLPYEVRIDNWALEALEGVHLTLPACPNVPLPYFKETMRKSLVAKKRVSFSEVA